MADDPEELASNVYGDNQIGGHARVQLGDRRITHHNHFHIGAVYLPYNERCEPLRIASKQNGTPQTLQHARGIDSGARRQYDVNRLKKSRSHESGRPGPRAQGHKEGRIESIDALTSISLRAQSAPGLVASPLAKHMDWKDIGQPMLILHDWLVRNQCIPRIQNGNIQKNHEERLVKHDNSFTAGDSATTVSSLSPQDHARREFLVLCAAILTCILGRNVSVHDILEFLSKCRHDQLMPVLTFLLGIVIYRYIAMSTIGRPPAAQHFLMLEDAYGQPRSLTLDVCIDFGILRKFLEVHYQQTNGKSGEALIRAGRFHLMLGSRRGRVIDAQDWSVPGRIKAGSRIVNSVYLTLDDTRCLRCQSPFTVTGNGEFHCQPCQVYHRDFDTFGAPIAARNFPFDEHVREGGSQKSVSPGPVRNADTTEMEEFNDRQPTPYQIDGLKHIDIRIAARSRTVNSVTISDSSLDFEQDGGDALQPRSAQLKRLIQNALDVSRLLEETSDLRSLQKELDSRDLGVPDPDVTFDSIADLEQLIRVCEDIHVLQEIIDRKRAENARIRDTMGDLDSKAGRSVRYDSGTVKWFNDTKGFGFITCNSGGKDAFVHHSAIQRDGLRTLSEGQKVEFSRILGPKGLMAVNVFVI